MSVASGRRRARLAVLALAAAAGLISFGWYEPVLLEVLAARGLGPGVLGGPLVARALEAARGPGPGAGAVYGAMHFAEPVAILLGGLLADRRLGARRAALAGAGLLCASWLALALPALSLLALPLRVAGVGLLAPGLPAWMDRLAGARRQASFVALYVAANVGMLASALAVAPLGRAVGWGAAFGLAGLALGAAAALARAAPAGARPRVASSAGRAAAVLALAALALAVFGALLVQCVALHRWSLARGEGTLDAPWLLQLPLNGALVVALAPPALAVLGRVRPRPSRQLAAGAGLVAVGLALPLGLAPALDAGGAGGLGVALIVGSTLALTAGELCIGPLALALLTRRAGARGAATAVAVWLVARDYGAELPAAVSGRLEGSALPLVFGVALALGAAAVARLAAGALDRPAPGRLS